MVIASLSSMEGHSLPASVKAKNACLLHVTEPLKIAIAVLARVDDSLLIAKILGQHLYLILCPLLCTPPSIASIFAHSV